MSDLKNLLVEDDKKSKSPVTPIKDDGLEHAWDWFKYHAEQRISMIRFYIVALGGVAAGIGFLYQQKFYFFCSNLSFFAAWMTFCFMRLDRRTSELVNLGQEALRFEQNLLAGKSGNMALNLCHDAEEPAVSFLGTYTKALSGIFKVACFGFIFFGINSIASSKILPRVVIALLDYLRNVS